MNAMFNTELEEAVNQFAEHKKCLLVAENALKSLEKMHGKQRRKLARQLLSDHKALTGTVPPADQNLIQQIQKKIRLVFHDLDDNESDRRAGPPLRGRLAPLPFVLETPSRRTVPQRNSCRRNTYICWKKTKLLRHM